MSLPRDRRVVSPSATAVPTQVGVTLVSTSSTAPQVTLEPLTSFKRSLEELGFTAPDEQGHRADSPIPVPSNTISNSAPSIVADRGSTGSPSEPHLLPVLYIRSTNPLDEDMMATTAISPQPSARSMHAARAMLARRRSSLATPPLLPPIHSQSHLLELIPDFTETRERVTSPASEVTGNSSTSETDVVLTTPASRARLHELRLRFSNISSSSSSSATTTRRIFRNTTLQRSAAPSNPTDTAPSQPRFSFENTASSHRSPTLPPIDTSDNGLGGLSSLLYTDPVSTDVRPAPPPSLPQTQPVPANDTLSNLATRSRTFLPSRPFVESPSPPISSIPASTATIASTLDNWARIREFEEAIAPLRNTPPPANARPRPPNLSLRPPALYPPVLPHPFEEVISPSTTAGESDEASEYNWEETQRSYRDELRYIHNLNTVLDEREAESGELTPVRTIPMLPPILPSPLLVTDGGLDFGNEVVNPTGRTRGEEETEWEADEVPSAWLREARRHFITSGPSREAGAPLLELPNISSTSLGLLDFPPSSSPTTANPLSSRISTEQLRQLPTEHLRQLRSFALRSVASRSRSRSSFAPSIVESISDGENRRDMVRPESVVSNEDIVVGVPPMLDEPFEGSVWRALEGSMPTEDGHIQQPHQRQHLPAAIDTRRQPRISLPPMSSGLNFDGSLLSGRVEVINDASSNVSVRSAVSSSSSGTAPPGTRIVEPELGEWREHINELVEGSLSSRSLPALALTPPPASTLPQRNAANLTGSQNLIRPTRSRASHARSASTGSGETFLDSTGLRQQFDLRREGNGGRLASAGRDNSLAVAMAEMDSRPFRASDNARSSIIVDHDREGDPVRDLLGLSDRSPRLSRGQGRGDGEERNTEAYRMLDAWWPESTTAAVQMINRELEFMDRYIMERTNESPRTYVGLQP